MNFFSLGSRWLLLTLILFHCLTILPIIGNIVTWIDPAWYTYHAFDLYYGRAIGTNLALAELFDITSDETLSFYEYDHTATPVWPYLVYPFFVLFEPDLVVARALSAIVMLLACVYLFKAIMLKFNDRHYAILGTGLFVADYTVFWASTSARPDALYTFLAIAGIYYLVKFLKHSSALDGAITALCFIAAILTHPLAAAVPATVMIIMAGSEFRLLIADRRLNWRRLFTQWWPLIATVAVPALWLVLNLGGLRGLIGTSSEFVGDGTPGVSIAAYLHEAFTLELTRKFLDAYARRYQLLTIVVFLLCIAYLILRYKTLNAAERQFLVFTVVLFAVIAVYDIGHTVPHLILQVPCISLAIAIVLRRVYRQHERAKWFVIALCALLMMNPLLPRAAKYYQVVRNGLATDYGTYADFISSHIPRNSKVLGDTTLIWGLHDRGYRLLQSHYVRPGSESYLAQIEYVVADAPLHESEDPFLRALPDFVDPDRITLIATMGEDCGYCYRATLYRIATDGSENSGSAPPAQ